MSTKNFPAFVKSIPTTTDRFEGWAVNLDWWKNYVRITRTREEARKAARYYRIDVGIPTVTVTKISVIRNASGNTRGKFNWGLYEKTSTGYAFVPILFSTREAARALNRARGNHGKVEKVWVVCR